MSNYPPGVSGNEYEIAGPDREWEEEFKCSNDEFEYVMISPHAHLELSKLGAMYNDTRNWDAVKEKPWFFLSQINTLINYSSITSEVQYAKCGYVGEVLKQSYRNEIWWDCPQCGKTYEETERDYYYE